MGGYAMLVSANGTAIALPSAAEADWGLRELTGHDYQTAILEDTLKPEDFNLYKAPRMQALGRLVSGSGSGVGAGRIGDMRRILQRAADEKSLALETDMADSLPALLLGDGTRLRQVLLNLAGNAIKFTARGSVTIRVQCERLQGSTLWVTIDVIDTGIGITAEQRRRIFEAFNQADNTITRRFGGTGLGLTISARLTELMGGTIDVTSEEGAGSTFSLHLPFGLPEGEHIAQGGAHVPGEHAGGLRVLVAEDNAVNQAVIRAMLAGLGHEPVVCANGKEAVDRFAEDTFDAVLMDLHMPELGGLEATRRIRALEAGSASRVPIVALTASAMSGDEEMCREAGMDGYVTKPVDRDALSSALRALRKPVAAPSA